MNIKIRNPKIELFSDPTYTTTDCLSKYTFTISTTPNANLTVVIVDSDLNGASLITFNNNGVSTDYTEGTYEIITPSTGKIDVVVKLGNVPLDAPLLAKNLAEIRITDNTNDKYDYRIYSRDVRGEDCSGLTETDEETPPPTEPSTDPTPQEPVDNCRAHFSGLTFNDVTEDDFGTTDTEFFTIPYQEDIYSEYVGAGEYPDSQLAFPKSIEYTFDGIAIDDNTRVIVYEEKDFKGKILLDEIGPKLVFNTIFTDFTDSTANGKIKDFTEPLQTNFQ
ncbi:MAG: hypothetical protein WD512_06685, partial [Candidatus Paceibacterota bacterium]